MPRRKWTFLRKFRFAFALAFLACMALLAVCVVAGIVSNLSWRYRDLDLPQDRPESLSDLGALELRDCLTALERMREELIERVHEVVSGQTGRDEALGRWKAWSRDWRTRFEKLGLSCRLTEYDYHEHPTLGVLAEIHRLLYYLYRTDDRLVIRFATENAQPLTRLRDLFDLARRKIEQIEGHPVQ